MGCQSCKDKGKKESLNLFTKDGDNEGESKDIGFTIFNFLIRILMFGIGLLATPIILLFVWYMLFKTIILNEGDVNLMPSMVMIGKTLGIGKKKSVEDKHPDDYEDIDSDNPDDYELNEKVDKVIL